MLEQFQGSKSNVTSSCDYSNDVQTANTALKELGDFQNYFEVLQREAAELADLLERLAEQQSQQKLAVAGQES